MYLKPLNVSQEYLDGINDDLRAWANKPESLTLAQFFACQNIGFPYFKRCTLTCPQLHNAYEVVKATLHTRWLKMAITNDELPKHKANVLMRYLRLYDSHGLLEERECKKEVEYAAAKAKADYEIEVFKETGLKEPFKAMYEANKNKSTEDH